MGGRESDAALDATSARKAGRAARYRRYERTRRRVRAKTSQGAIASTYPTRAPCVPRSAELLRRGLRIGLFAWSLACLLVDDDDAGAHDDNTHATGTSGCGGGDGGVGDLVYDGSRRSNS